MKRQCRNAIVSKESIDVPNKPMTLADSSNRQTGGWVIGALPSYIVVKIVDRITRICSSPTFFDSSTVVAASNSSTDLRSSLLSSAARPSGSLGRMSGRQLALTTR